MRTYEIQAKLGDAGAAGKRKKAPYSAPTLRVYGAVNQLTGGRSGIGTDRRARQMMNGG